MVYSGYNSLWHISSITCLWFILAIMVYGLFSYNCLWHILVLSVYGLWRFHQQVYSMHIIPLSAFYRWHLPLYHGIHYSTELLKLRTWRDNWDIIHYTDNPYGSPPGEYNVIIRETG